MITPLFHYASSGYHILLWAGHVVRLRRRRNAEIKTFWTNIDPEHKHVCVCVCVCVCVRARARARMYVCTYIYTMQVRY
jgi:hypothetical protein